MQEHLVNNVEHRPNEQNQSNLEETGRVIMRTKPKPMQPTRLYIFFFSLFNPFDNK
jgi:hypothetical protein